MLYNFLKQSLFSLRIIDVSRGMGLEPVLSSIEVCVCVCGGIVTWCIKLGMHERLCRMGGFNY